MLLLLSLLLLTLLLLTLLLRLLLHLLLLPLLPLLLCHPRRLHCSTPAPDPIEVRTAYACAHVLVLLV